MPKSIHFHLHLSVDDDSAQDPQEIKDACSGIVNAYRDVAGVNIHTAQINSATSASENLLAPPANA